MRQYSGQTQVPDTLVLVQETGGTDTAWARFVAETVKILVRDIDQVAARKAANDIYDLLHGRFGLILPAVTIGADTYQEIQTAQISAIQRPFCLGVDENDRVEFTTNYQIIWSYLY